MASKKHTFEIDALSSAIDKIVVQGSKVFINFSGNEKSYEYTWKPANKTLLAKLGRVLLKILLPCHLGDFIMIL